MSLRKVLGLAMVLAGLSTNPAYAIIDFIFHDPRPGCRQLIRMTHPDLKGPEFREEMRKCIADPQGYNDASGLSPPQVH